MNIKQIPLTLLTWLIAIHSFSQNTFTGDVKVKSSLAVGLDTPDNPVFGFNTVLLTENNLRIHFDDTSDDGFFADNDWTLVANSSEHGGKSYFAIEDATAGVIPFKVMAGAKADALFVAEDSKIGIGTNTPATPFHISNDDTPAIRLDQNNSGWGEQAWDIAGNESNFFIRDASVGNLLPFRIKPKAPTNSLFIAANGNLGFGTELPKKQVHINTTSTPTIRLEQNKKAQIWDIGASDSIFFIRDITNGNTTPFLIAPGAPNNAFYIDTKGNIGLGQNEPPTQKLDVNGNIRLNGALKLTPQVKQPQAAEEGDIYFDGNDHQLKYYNSTEWKSLTAGQKLTLTDNKLSIDNGNTISLAAYLDNTDTQKIALNGTRLSIENGNSVDLSAIQDGYEANTDEQTLSIKGTELSITGGNTVDLSGLLESISSRLDDQEALLTTQKAKIEDLEADIALLKSYHKGSPSVVMPTTFSNAELYQNKPNPASSTTRINYYLPDEVKDARLLVYDINGKLYKDIPLYGRGMDAVEIAEGELHTGNYFYTLLAEGQKVATKKMIITF